MTSLTAILLLALAAPTGGRAGVPALAGSAPDNRLKAELQLGHYPGAAEVFQCMFESGRDAEIYGWPPGWTRRFGPGFPRYVRIRVDDEHPPSGGRCLCVDLNGGAASAFGPSITVEPGVDYMLEGYVKTAALEHDAAWISLTFLDSARLKLSRASSEKIGGTADWRKLRAGPIVPPPGAATMIVGVHVAPQGAAQDIQGAASFGSLWVGSLPRVVLSARSVEVTARPAEPAEANDGDSQPLAKRGSDDASFWVFERHKQQPIEVTCLVSGFKAPRYDVRLTLDDVIGRTLAQHAESFSDAGSAGKDAKSNGTKVVSLAGNAAHVSWLIPADTVGYYRVRAEVIPLSAREGAAEKAIKAQPGGATSGLPPATLALAIIDRQSPPANSEFGWSLDAADVKLGLAPLGDLLAQAGIRSVKFPFVCSLHAEPSAKQAKSPSAPPAKPRGSDRIEPLINFGDRLADAGVRLVGVLLPPTAEGDSPIFATTRLPSGYPEGSAKIGTVPPSSAATSAPGFPKHDLLAADVFAGDPKSWYPSIEPVLARLANEIRYWQIGDDRDPGWNGCSELAAAVSLVKGALDRIGQNLDVGLAWDFAAPLPVGAPGASQKAGTSKNNRLEPELQRAPWRFLTLPCSDALTDAEIAERLDGTASAHIARWLAIAALPRAGHSEEERIEHLANRLIAAKMHGAEGIFFAHPFDPERGLIGRDGSPSELFVPWRTTALTLGGAAYAGDIDCAGGSRIHCFGSHAKYVGVLPAGLPQRESVYLGDELRSRDLWGHDEALPPTKQSDRNCSSPDVKTLPLFLAGLDGAITEWQLSAGFRPQSLPSIPLADVPVVLHTKNIWKRRIAGRVRIAPPANWQVEPQSADFRIEQGAAWRLPLQVSLPNDVIAGRQVIALEFEIQADRFYRFTMYRTIDIALGDVAMDARMRLTDHGDLEVRQTLSNQGKRAVGFRCDLAAPDRRRQSIEIVLQPAEKNDFVYRLSDGRELLGKPLWLRAEEIDGPRVMNFRLVGTGR